MIDIILYTTALIALIASSFSDINIREVPDWVSYSLIIAALFTRLVFSLTLRDWHPIAEGFAGFAGMIFLALLMFYTGQWGGGDSKILMGMGAVFGFPIPISHFPLLVMFIINLLFIGAIYGLIWSLFIVIKRYDEFKTKMTKVLKRRENLLTMKFVFIFSFCIIILAFFTDNTLIQGTLLFLAGISIVTFFMAISVKTVENVCMYKKVSPSKLTEGDWIAKDIKINGKLICGPKDLGISKAQIKELNKLKKQKKISLVLIKEGIPFIPSFLIAFIVTLIFQNWLIYLL